MVLTILILILFFSIWTLIFEAFAHSFIIDGLTRCGQPKKENKLWHIFFFSMWTCLALVILLMDFLVEGFSLWKIVVFLATSRLFVFASVLNLLRGKEIHHLGADFIDSALQRIGEKPAFIIRGLIWISSIILIFIP